MGEPTHLPILGMRDVQEAHSLQLGLGVAEETAERGVHLEEDSNRRHGGHPRRRSLEDRAESLLAGPQSLLGLPEDLQIGDILEHDDGLIDLAGEGLDGHGRRVNVTRSTVDLQADFVVGHERGLEGLRRRALFADRVAAAKHLVALGSQKPNGVGSLAESAGEDAVGPDDPEGGIENEKPGVGVVDHRGELLAFPLQDPHLLVEESEPALVLLQLGSEVLDRLGRASGCVPGRLLGRERGVFPEEAHETPVDDAEA